MIKTSLFCLLLTATTFPCAHAESTEELYKKVFGKKQESKKIEIDATLGDFYLGGIEAVVSGENIISLSGRDLQRVLFGKIRESKKNRYVFGDKEIEPSKLPFKITYISSELRLKLELPIEDLVPVSANIYDDLVPYYSKKSVEPAIFSFGTNYKLEDVQVNKLDQQDSFSVQTDSFMNLKNVALENQMNYLSTRNSAWYRQNSKLTFDRPGHMQRMEMGDVTYPIIGYQQNRTVGGVSFYKDFSLNPYRSSNPTSSFEYEITGRSLVRTFVNGAVIKTEYMNPGRYSVKDVPLNNGLNKIIVEVTDEFGKKKIFVFNEASSIDALAPGLSRFALTAGLPSTDTDTQKKYDKSNGTFYSAFYQHGIVRNWSLGGYSQGNKNYSLFGANNNFLTPIGNWSIDGANSKNKFHSGPAIQGNYQLNLFGINWYESHSLNARIEYRSPWFNENGDAIINRFDYIATTSYSIPFMEKFNISIGGNYQHPRIGDVAKYGFDTSITSRIFNSSSLTFYYARTRDENRLWNTQLYMFLNFTFGESSTFSSAFYDKTSQTKRLTMINDDGKKLNSLKAVAIADDNASTRNGSLDLQYNTALADLGLREEIINTKGSQTGSRTSLRLLSSFAYVHDNGESAFSVSRPISNSFVIFKPADGWKKQRFGVKSSSDDNDTETGLFGESLISGLMPYQYRRLQLDPSYLEPGYSLGQESFVVYPHYRSGHLFVVGQSGLLVLKGIILDKDQHPIALRVGYWTSTTGKSTPFFTGRNGEFLIEGAEPASGKIQLDDEQFEAKELNLAGKKSGIIDIGNVVVPFKESRL